MVQWLRALTALPENRESLPSTYMVAHSCLELQHWRASAPSVPLQTLGTHTHK